MASTRKTKLVIWITALTLVLACVPSLGTPSIPTLDRGAINTFIVQTANAAGTQTATGLPSPTQTAVLIRNTETPTATATSTVVFLFFSPTPLVLPTFTAASSSNNFACQLIRVSPPNGSTFSPRQDFNVFWTVKNIGKKSWERTSVDYTYSLGAKIHKISSYDLSDDVPVRTSIDLVVDMRAPKDPGSYTTTWIMRSGNKTFCPLNLSIVVQPQS